MASIFVRLKKNHLVMINGQRLAPPMKMVNAPLPLPLNHQGGYATTKLIPRFQMDHVFEISLPDVTPRIPKQRAGQSDSFYQKIVDAAETKAIENRQKLAALASRIKVYVNSGVLEIVRDSEGALDLELADAEIEAAGLKVEERIPTSPAQVAHAIAQQRVKGKRK